MVTSINNVLDAYAAAASQANRPGMAARDDGVSFGEMLQEATRQATDRLKASEVTTAQALVGQADLNDVVAAVNNAEVTLRTVTAIRDKVITAYQEILRTPI